MVAPGFDFCTLKLLSLLLCFCFFRQLLPFNMAVNVLDHFNNIGIPDVGLKKEVFRVNAYIGATRRQC
jgi:hypothetical protein